jgi:hypothetical protein
MPTIKEIQKQKKPFKKREYRPYNIHGNSLQVIDNIISEDNIYNVNPELIKNWEYHDRPNTELVVL